MKGGSPVAEAYLCGTAPVQNTLLALRNSAEVSSQHVATGGTGEGGVTKGPGKVTPGDGIFGLIGTPITALGRSVDESPNLSPHSRTRGLPEVDQLGATCGRLEKMVPSHDR
jgi:hypothetical protein